MARLQAMFNVLEAAHNLDVFLHVQENRKHRMRERFRLMRGDQFVAVYRLNRELFSSLCDEVVPLLGFHTKRAISPETKILTALEFYASGSYQTGLGMSKHSSMCQQSVSKVIRQVTEALNTPEILHKYIRFPQNQLEREEIKKGFYSKFGMPGVVSCIDGTHVALIKPKENEERFFNQKYYHSLNVQIMTQSDLKITSVDASYGGASQDSYIWSQHPVKNHLEVLKRNGEDAWLLGDSEYAQRCIMMTPLEKALPGSPEEYYNTVHKKTHNTIARAVEVLKGRWRCLLAARELHYDPRTAGKIVNACCVLHNMCIDANLPASRLTAHELEAEQQWQMPHKPGSDEAAATSNDEQLQAGREARTQLAVRLWRQR